jgi:hypothetical protein
MIFNELRIFEIALSFFDDFLLIPQQQKKAAKAFSTSWSFLPQWVH